MTTKASTTLQLTFHSVFAHSRFIYINFECYCGNRIRLECRDLLLICSNGLQARLALIAASYSF